jgi:hypothetical protein
VIELVDRNPEAKGAGDRKETDAEATPEEQAA